MFIKPLLSIVCLLFSFFELGAQQLKPDTLKYCTNQGRIGLGGYDAISYFRGNKPVLGNKLITSTYDGVDYYFSSKENRSLFIATPEKYLPQFGGWCSMTMVQGKATTPTYSNFLIQNGKFYLFERTLSVNGKELWLKDFKKNEEAATQNYNQYIKTGKIK